MNHSEYRVFSDFVKERKIVFYYYGYFSQTIVSAVAETIQLSMKQADTTAAVKRKLFSCFVEMAQNIIHYSSEALTPATQDDAEVRQGSVCIGHTDDRFYLMCSNRVSANDMGPLREKLEPLKSMTLEEIKRAYQDTLRSEQPEGSKGSGLGFLTVARDASKPLEFEFAPLDNHDDMMFYLKVTV